MTVDEILDVSRVAPPGAIAPFVEEKPGSAAPVATSDAAARPLVLRPQAAPMRWPRVFPGL